MKKFDSDACILEVCAYAQHAPGYLNRQLITLLMDKCLGVPDESFRELQVLSVTIVYRQPAHRKIPAAMMGPSDSQ